MGPNRPHPTAPIHRLGIRRERDEILDGLDMTSLIKSVGYNQTDIISSILQLEGEERFELDPTYSRGCFYNGISGPEIKMDLHPQSEDVIQADCRNLPLPDESVRSIMFDPPFIAGGAGDSIMAKRFGSFDSVYEMWDFMKNSLDELNRVLKTHGLLVVKCQDMVNGRQQYLTHIEIILRALDIGFYPKDVFILIARNRPVRENLKVQCHARKFHSYFLVFKKSRRNIAYSLSPCRERMRVVGGGS